MQQFKGIEHVAQLGGAVSRQLLPIPYWAALISKFTHPSPPCTIDGTTIQNDHEWLQPSNGLGDQPYSEIGSILLTFELQHYCTRHSFIQSFQWRTILICIRQQIVCRFQQEINSGTEHLHTTITASFRFPSCVLWTCAIGWFHLVVSTLFSVHIFHINKSGRVGVESAWNLIPGCSPFICSFATTLPCVQSLERIAWKELSGKVNPSVHVWKDETTHGLGMRCGLGSLLHISELNSAILFLRLKNKIALFSSEMCRRLPSPHLIPRPWTGNTYFWFIHSWVLPCHKIEKYTGCSFSPGQPSSYPTVALRCQRA